MGVNAECRQMVREFQALFAPHMNSERMEIPEEAVVLMRSQALAEETAEYMHAVGRGDRVETLDALCDLQYFLDGTALAYGLGHVVVEPRGVVRAAPYPRAEAGKALFGASMLLYAISDLTIAADVWVARTVLERMQCTLDDLFREHECNELKLEAFSEVHRSNMNKLHDGRVVRDASGRVVKPEGWRPPDLSSVLYGEVRTV